MSIFVKKSLKKSLKGPVGIALPSGGDFSSLLFSLLLTNSTRCLVNKVVQSLYCYMTVRCFAVLIWLIRVNNSFTVAFTNELCMKLTQCRVLSLSDRRYSLNPLSQTRID